MTTKTCPCGSIFAPTHQSQKYCPACREQRNNARKPQVKPCTKCGTPTRNRRQRKPFCSVCFAEASRKMRDEIKERRKADYQRQLDAQRAQRERDEYEQQKEDYFRHLEQSPEEVQRQHLLVALAWLINVVAGESETPERAPTVEEVHPEQIPHDDQDVIDAEFYRIMASVNW